MIMYHVEGIGELRSNPTLRILSKTFLVLCFICLGIVGVVGLIAVIITRNPRAIVPYEISIPGLLALLLVGVFLGIGYLIRRQFSLGDLYYEIDHDQGDPRAAAQTLLKFTETDILTSKLQAKAHLYLAYKGDKDHWAAMIAVVNAILDQEPDNMAFRLDRAQAYQHQGNYNEALRDLEVAIAGTKQPTLRAQSMRISCLTAVSRLEEARLRCDELEQMIDHLPDQNEVIQAVALHRAEIAQHEQATNLNLAVSSAG